MYSEIVNERLVTDGAAGIDDSIVVCGKNSGSKSPLSGAGEELVESEATSVPFSSNCGLAYDLIGLNPPTVGRFRI